MSCSPPPPARAQVRARGVILDAELVRFSPPDGVLEIDFRPRLAVRLRLGSWNAGLPLLRHDEGVWREDRSDPQVLFFHPGARLAPPHPVALFAQTIPQQALDIASQFGAWHLTILRLLRQSRAAIRLAQSSPNLLWLFAATADRSGLRPEQVREWLRLGRIALLSRALAISATRTTLRLVNKFAPSVRSRDELELLERAAANPSVVDSLRKVPLLLPQDLRRLFANPTLQSCGCIGDVLLQARTRPGVVAEARSLVADLRRIGRERDLAKLELSLARTPTLRRLVQIYERL